MTSAALPVLRTPRLTLRPPESTDADAITEGIGNYDVCKWLSSVPYPYPREEAVRWLKKNVGSARQCWLISEADRVVGCVSNEREFGFWLARPVWRRGYAFEAGHTAINHWFSNPSAGNLLSGYFPGNERSAAALYALGFENIAVNPHEARALGQTVDAQELRLTREAWEARQRPPAIFVFQRFPPFETNVPWIDVLGLSRVDFLGSLEPSE
ncbi:MAG: GNAT family N-acetyltransferase [Pseudomonadota bacterium]